MTYLVECVTIITYTVEVEASCEHEAYERVEIMQDLNMVDYENEPKEHRISHIEKKDK